MEDETVRCDAPGGCGEPARQVLLVRSGENMIGNGMAVWTAHWRCGADHRGDDDARRIRSVDPEARVITFMSQDGSPLEPGAYLAATFR